MTFEEIFDEQARKQKLYITEENIHKISVPKLKLFDADECKRIAEVQKELLKEAMTKNESNEVGFLINLVDWSWIIIRGSERGISIKANPEARETLITAPAKSLIFIHNHPRNSVFSERDLNSFLTSDAIMLVTVVCNNGRTYYLEKNNEFDPNKALKYYDELFEDESIEHTVKEFLRTCRKVGLSFYYGGN